MGSGTPAEGEGRGRGRPRKWASDAERARAYRARRAAELAEPEQLRAERRALSQTVRELEDELGDERRRRLVAEQRVERLVEQLRDAGRALAEAQRLVGQLATGDRGDRGVGVSEPEAAPAIPPPLNRAERRALARRRRPR